MTRLASMWKPSALRFRPPQRSPRNDHAASSTDAMVSRIGPAQLPCGRGASQPRMRTGAEGLLRLSVWMGIVVGGGMASAHAQVAQTDAFRWNLPPGWSHPDVPPDNPMTAAKVELGRHLFYDRRLS